MKWAGMYFAGFVVIGAVIVLGLGMMLAVTNSGSKENIQIDRK